MKYKEVYTPGIFHGVYNILGLPILTTVSSFAIFFEEYDGSSLSSLPRCLISICYSILNILVFFLFFFYFCVLEYYNLRLVRISEVEQKFFLRLAETPFLKTIKINCISLK